MISIFLRFPHFPVLHFQSTYICIKSSVSVLLPVRIVSMNAGVSKSRRVHNQVRATVPNEVRHWHPVLWEKIVFQLPLKAFSNKLRIITQSRQQAVPIYTVGSPNAKLILRQLLHSTYLFWSCKRLAVFRPCNSRCWRAGNRHGDFQRLSDCWLHITTARR